jgi:DNA adenine methylase
MQYTFAGEAATKRNNSFKLVSVNFNDKNVRPVKNKLSPFVKWAGGKSQLLNEIDKIFPKGMGTHIDKYAEPFVGGGAVLFYILSKYDLKQVYISDINTELINTYLVIRDNISQLIDKLFIMQEDFLALSTEYRKEYFYKRRELFNKLKVNSDSTQNIEKAALFIFLNKTCFNGLYRVNQKGFFNVPMGSYKKPKICDIENLSKISVALQKVKIINGDYHKSSDFIDQNTLVYFDPPYRPINDTSSFTAYSESIFDDNAQIELANYISSLNEKGAKIILSNSDPKNFDIEDNFFDNLYAKYNIKRVEATRMINCNGDLRGKIRELLICNY